MMMIVVIRAALLAVVLPIAGQVFKAETELVTVPVTVRAAGTGKVLPELTAADFRIFEDGVPQTISQFTHMPRAMSVCIVLDSSYSMQADRRLMARYAVDTLLDGLRDADEASILRFSSGVEMAMPWTRAREIPPRPWHEWRVSSGTSMFDAVHRATAYIANAKNPLAVVVVVSDGGENTSGTSLSALARPRRESETLVYAIRTFAQIENPRRAEPAFGWEEGSRLTERFGRPSQIIWQELDWSPQIIGDSGGTLYHVQHPAGATKAAQALLDELRSLYTIGYVPAKALDGKYRRIKVEAVSPGLRVRHRNGYLAAAR
jgi:VWFA-related protein